MQHSGKAGQERLEERIDRLDTDIIVIEEHSAETSVRTLAQDCIGRLGVAQHERTRA